jgi:outer membrane protein
MSIDRWARPRIFLSTTVRMPFIRRAPLLLSIPVLLVAIAGCRHKTQPPVASAAAILPSAMRSETAMNCPPSQSKNRARPQRHLHAIRACAEPRYRDARGPIAGAHLGHEGYSLAGADLSVPVWASGKISGAIGAAAAGARGANAQEVRSTADLKLAVAESYVAVFRARRALNVAESNVASLQAHADDVQVMYDKQAVPQSDVLAAQVALANATQQRLRAANALHLATAAYNHWVGQPRDRAPDLDEPSATPSADAAEPLDQLIAQAIERRPELAAVSAQQEGLEQTAQSERAQGLPQVVLHAGYNHVDNQILDRENFASIGIGFQWRLFDSGQLQARTSALRSRAHAAEHRLADLQSQVRLDVETAFYNREEAAARIHAASAAVAQAQENLRIAKELYDSGLGTNNQVLDAETVRIVAITNRDDASFDALIAEYRLQRAIGVL